MVGSNLLDPNLHLQIIPISGKPRSGLFWNSPGNFTEKLFYHKSYTPPFRPALEYPGSNWPFPDRTPFYSHSLDDF
jgi:hypothetical protein